MTGERKQRKQETNKKNPAVLPHCDNNLRLGDLLHEPTLLPKDCQTEQGEHREQGAPSKEQHSIKDPNLISTAFHSKRDNLWWTLMLVSCT